MTRLTAVTLLTAILCACEPSDTASDREYLAQRIVTLAPHLTELAFAAGAGDLLVGVSGWSDYPPAAAELPVVSDAFAIDQEQLALLRPDLLLAWKSGTPAHVVSELRAAGHAVEVIETRGLEDVARAIERIGEISGRREDATAVANDFRSAVASLRAANSGKAPISVFYQISARPLYTINREHYIGEIIELCGGDNIFADVEDLAPPVTVESVVDRDPETLLATDADGEFPFADWARWDHLAANRYGNYFVVTADTIARPTPRLVLAAAEVCKCFDQARTNREAGSEQ